MALAPLLRRRNCGLLAAAFERSLAPIETWGDGISRKMIEELAAAGFDRLWLGADGWTGFVKRPETVTAARAHGYLIGTYDSYHSIHRPDEPETWATAQFDPKLYRSGAIIQADGTKKHGFKRKGYLLSPQAARPFVEKRVTNLMQVFHANSWFIDCDAFGDVFEACQASTGQSVAVKVLRATDRKNAQQRFLREMRACAALHKVPKLVLP